jgi:hypothetical protein
MALNGMTRLPIIVEELESSCRLGFSPFGFSPFRVLVALSLSSSSSSLSSSTTLSRKGVEEMCFVKKSFFAGLEGVFVVDTGSSIRNVVFDAGSLIRNVVVDAGSSVRDVVVDVGSEVGIATELGEKIELRVQTEVEVVTDVRADDATQVGVSIRFGVAIEVGVVVCLGSGVRIEVEGFIESFIWFESIILSSVGRDLFSEFTARISNSLSVCRFPPNEGGTR